MVLQPCEQREGLVEYANQTCSILIETASLRGENLEVIKSAIEAMGAVTTAGIELGCAGICGQGVCYLAQNESGQVLTEKLKNEREAAEAELHEIKASQFVTYELENVSGQELKEIIMKRIEIFEDPELVAKLTARYNLDNPNQTITEDEFSEIMREFITPVKDDATWDTFARFIKGNIRLAQSVMAFFQGAHPMFRSDKPKYQARAAVIAESYVSRDGSWSRTYRGFQPANPYEITDLDFNRLAEMIDENGWLHLSDGVPGCFTMCKVTDDPEEYAEWKMKDGEIIDLVQGNSNVLPQARIAGAIEASSKE